ncbi:MAG: PQQ-binding-like beta-propeller repeat protein [Pyrinomonadaceae bacterium]
MYSHRLFLILLATLALLSACLPAGFPLRREFVESKSVTNFTVVGEDIYFGAGYSIFKFNSSSRLITEIYRTDNARVEQPLLADGIIYFGGLDAFSKHGLRGENEGFFAYDLRTERLLWKFPLHEGYGTFGTFPVISEDRILVCSRWHLHSIDRKSGKELWKVDNWMGSTGDTVILPYVFDNQVYFMVEEEHVAGTKKTDENDGHWAEVNIESGERSIFQVADRPGTYEDSSGTGIGTLADGVIYGNSRVDRFGALDLRAKKYLWEVPTDTLIKPVVQDGKIYLIRNEEIQALDQKTGKTLWAKPLDVFSNTIKSNSIDRRYEENYTRRVTSDGRFLIIQGSLAVGALELSTGKELWRKDLASKSTSVAPIIMGSSTFVISENDCSIVQFDLPTGKEMSRTQIPDCSYYRMLDD